MTVSIIKVTPGAPIDTPVIRNVVSNDGLIRAFGYQSTLAINRGSYAVYPIHPDGIFDGQESTITNTDARYSVVTQDPRGGTFTHFNGGAWVWSSGPSTTPGTASFSYVVSNYIGDGDDITGHWNVVITS